MTQEAIQISETPPLPGLQLVQQANGAIETVATDFAGDTDPASVAGAYMTWADTANGLLKRRNAANTAWITVGQLWQSSLPVFSSGGTLPTLDIGPIYQVGTGVLEWAGTAYTNRQPSLRVTTSATQSLAVNTYTLAAFDQLVFDSHSWYTTANRRFTPKIPGRYFVSYYATFNLSTSASQSFAGINSVYKNGVEELWATGPAAIGSGQVTVSVSGLVYLNGTTDYVQPYSYISSPGSGITASIGQAGGGPRNAFSVFRVGP